MIAAGVDVGSSSIKVALISVGDAVRTLAVRSATTPDDADLLRAIVLRLLGEVVAVAVPQVVGIASMAETGVPLDPDGRALTPLVRWNAGLDDFGATALIARAGRRELFAATGVRPAPKVPLAMWLSLSLAQRWRWSGAADLVALALTGRLVTDHTLAGRTMAYRLPAAGEAVPGGFDADLAALAGMSVGRLPQVRRPDDPPVPSLAVAGLPAGTPVVVAGHDHQVGAWAAGVRASGERADSLGTSESVIRILDRPVDLPSVQDQGMSVVRTVSGATDALVAGSGAAGAVIRWWLETFVPPSLRTTALSPPVPDPPDLVVRPYPTGRQAPSPDPSLRFEIRSSAGDLVDPVTIDPVLGAGAVIHAVARQARWMAEVQDRLAGSAAAGTTVLAGSGPLVPAWLAAKAAVSAGPLSVVDAAEPVAIGAALLAAVRAGLADPQIRLPATVRPAGADSEASYRAFLAAVTR